MHAPRPMPLGIVVYSNTLLHVSLFIASVKQYLPFAQEERSHTPQRGYGRPGPWGGGTWVSLPSKHQH